MVDSLSAQSVMQTLRIPRVHCNESLLYLCLSRWGNAEIERERKFIMASMAVARKALGDMIKAFKPLADRVLVERFAAETKTKGGIMIPDKAQGKVLEATVISTGPGGRDSKGNLIPMTVQAGDHVLLPEYGGTKVVVEEKEYHIFREADILGKFQE
ncbi:10 kDa heat shock protein, mitochondrial [Dirofilaria immitis]|nr:10 kDa heat shock protein, mitochondrial [Dirofilaria immitis]